MSNQKINKNEVRKEIASLIDSIKKQADHIGFTREIPQVELDLIIHQIEHLYRKTIVFSYLNTIPEEETVQQPSVAAPVQPAIQPVEPTPVNITPVVEPLTEVKPVNVEPVAEIKPVVEPVAEIIEPVVEQKPIVPEVKQEEIVKPVDPIPPVEPTPVVEKVVEPIPVPEKKVEPKPASSNFRDLKTLIGFNERIMFMRNLFASDGAAYDEALQQLNGCNSFAESDSFLSVLRGEYRWNADSEAVQTFYDVVKRRFA